jgi:ATP-dependent helicase/DNAse subunit B
LFLAYRSSDEEGNLALPSPFIADVAELLDVDWPARRRRRLLADVVWDPQRAPTDRERARAAADRGAASGGEPPEHRRVLGPAALGRMRHTEILSAGALEAYANCPVRWLIERELQPEQLIPEAEAMARGSLMHDVLERVLRELDGPVTPDTLAGAQAILDRLLAALAADGGAALGVGSPEVVRAGALRAIEADLRRYLAHEARTAGEWRPLGLELRFGFEGEEGSLPALELGEGPDRVRVRGVVDRVDVDGTGQAVVRDYKSGARRPAWSAARWSEDRQLQVALYMLVVR